MQFFHVFFHRFAFFAEKALNIPDLLTSWFASALPVNHDLSVWIGPRALWLPYVLLPLTSINIPVRREHFLLNPELKKEPQAD